MQIIIQVFIVFYLENGYLKFPQSHIKQWYLSITRCTDSFIMSVFPSLSVWFLLLINPSSSTCFPFSVVLSNDGVPFTTLASSARQNHITFISFQSIASYKSIFIFEAIFISEVACPPFEYPFWYLPLPVSFPSQSSFPQVPQLFLPFYYPPLPRNSLWYQNCYDLPSRFIYILIARYKGTFESFLPLLFLSESQNSQDKR